MKLKKILNQCKTEYKCLNLYDFKIRGICTNSEEVKENYIFGAIQGQRFNGESFLGDFKRISKLVVVLSIKSKLNFDLIEKNIIVIKTKNVRKFISEISYIFYPNSLKEIIGVTGTNGKTSIADYTRQIWTQKKIDCCSIGTLGIIHNKKKIFDQGLTTPDPITLNKKLNFLSKKGCKKIIIEASSIGLEQNRLFPLKFKKVIFSNLSRDHIDYHKTFNNYKEAKSLLFKYHTYKNTVAIINSDSIHSKYFLEICRKKKIKILDFGKKASFLKIISIKKFSNFYNVNFLLNRKKIEISIYSFSIYEIYNKLSALLAVFGEKIDEKKFIFLKNLYNPPGRIEKIRNKKKLNIFVDYAHTPDALKNVLSSLKKVCKGKLITVIGCGGERDTKKRPLMTKEALKYSDKIIITDDNPRNENPKKIRKEMISKISKNQKLKISEISNRRKAIEYSINIMDLDDFLIIAGKGHENYQEIRSRKFYFSDKNTVLKFINK